jgi:hypothetical protein
MDPATLAAAVLPAVLAWLRKAGGGVLDDVAESAGTAVVDKLKQIYQAVRARFSGDEFAERALDRVAEDTESVPRQRTLEAVLAERLSDDPDFAGALDDLLNALSDADRASIVAINTGIAAGGNVTQSGRYVAGRDLTINDRGTP